MTRLSPKTGDFAPVFLAGAVSLFRARVSLAWLPFTCLRRALGLWGIAHVRKCSECSRSASGLKQTSTERQGRKHGTNAAGDAGHSDCGLAMVTFIVISRFHSQSSHVPLGRTLAQSASGDDQLPVLSRLGAPLSASCGIDAYRSSGA